MKRIFVLICSINFVITCVVEAQTYNIVIKNGHLIDPKNNIDEVLDVAIKDGKIVKVAKEIDKNEGIQIVNAKGFYITPGLIDIHVHVFHGTKLPDQVSIGGKQSIIPDIFTLRVGVTTVVDAGSCGWSAFPAFKRQTIDRSHTRVLSWLNIDRRLAGAGMKIDGEFNIDRDMNSKITAEFARNHAEDTVGIKWREYGGNGWIHADCAIEAARLADMPVMIHWSYPSANPPYSLEELFMKHLRPGDIYTHTFTQDYSGKGTEYIVDLQTNTLKPFVLEARKRGIIFDVAHGQGSFNFSQAMPAIKAGFYPDVISTDIHTGCMIGAMKDILTTMSKFMAMGMDFKSVIKATTWTPAQVIRREELGNLSVGSEADIAILNIRKGRFGLFDVRGIKIETDEIIECEMTIRAGNIVYDLNGIAVPIMPGNN